MVLGKLAARVLAGLNYLHRERHQVRAHRRHVDVCAWHAGRPLRGSRGSCCAHPAMRRAWQGGWCGGGAGGGGAPTTRCRRAVVLLLQVHRDMKPGNILLNSRGEVKISDFGLSAELDSTKEMCATFIGTHAYMSPERLGGKPYSFASDIWSLGITLVECALGQFPYTAYTGSNYFVLLSQILNDPPPQLPPEVTCGPSSTGWW